MRLKKYVRNPILIPNENNPWESAAVCNPGAWYEDGKFYLLYRAAGHDLEHYIYFGLAESEDGFNFKRVSDEPVVAPLENNYDGGCVEDARIVKYDDTFFVTYAYRPYWPGQYWNFEGDSVQMHETDKEAPRCVKENMANSGLLMSKDLRNFRRLGRITKSNLDDRDVILFPEKVGENFVMLHRPKEWVGEDYGCEYPSMWISYSKDLMEWEKSELLITGATGWEKKIGGSTPPIKTEAGWLTLYHGVDDNGIYRVGAMLLDLENPSKVIARAKDYIMEPEFEYEIKGFYNGVVFPTGNMVVGDTLYVYYGGADKYCCVATCDINELVAFVLQYKEV